MTDVLTEPRSAQRLQTRRFAALDAATVMRMWSAINAHVLFGLPPLASKNEWSEERILAAINRGELTLWAYTEGARILALISTTLTGDTITGTRAMLIYSAHSDGGLDVEDWRTIISGLGVGAKAAGAARLVAYSDVDRVIELVEALGGEVKQRLLELPIGE